MLKGHKTLLLLVVILWKGLPSRKEKNTDVINFLWDVIYWVQ